MTKPRRIRHSATQLAVPPVRVIIALSGGRTSDDVTSGTDQSVTLKLPDMDLQLTAQHVTSDDGIEWYSALVPASKAERIISTAQAHPRVESAYLQPPEGPPT